MKFLIMVTLLLASTASAEETDNTVLGLEFGQTIAQVKAAGVVLADTRDDHGLVSATADNVPKPIPGFVSYLLAFFDKKLVKVGLVGEPVTDDIYGTTGKQRFDALLEVLKKKYKVNQDSRLVGVALYKKPDEFYQCLAYSGCGRWVVFLAGGGKELMLELKGAGRGKGYLTLYIEGPGFNLALEEIKRRKEQIMEEAL